MGTIVEKLLSSWTWIGPLVYELLSSLSWIDTLAYELVSVYIHKLPSSMTWWALKYKLQSHFALIGSTVHGLLSDFACIGTVVHKLVSSFAWIDPEMPHSKWVAIHFCLDMQQSTWVVVQFCIDRHHSTWACSCLGSREIIILLSRRLTKLSYRNPVWIAVVRYCNVLYYGTYLGQNFRIANQKCTNSEGLFMPNSSKKLFMYSKSTLPIQVTNTGHNYLGTT
jgi:hypothetical protein